MELYLFIILIQYVWQFIDFKAPFFFSLLKYLEILHFQIEYDYVPNSHSIAFLSDDLFMMLFREASNQTYP